MQGVLVLVRHGRTAENAKGLLLGRLDPELDEVGVGQAARIAEAVAGASRVIASPLRRAQQTAAALGRPVETDDRWIELDYGEFDGLPARSVGADVWAHWRTDVSYRPPGGESLLALHHRVAGACVELLAEATEVDVVVVSHVSPIKAAVAWALGAGMETAWRTHLDQASISRVALGPSGPILRSFNETHHLGVALGAVRLSG
jgi:broad specificity phosphatase PhoE